MSRSSKADWKRKNGDVTWADVEQWCEDIRRDFGLWAQFKVCPPLPSVRRRNLGQVGLVLTRYIDGGRVQESKMWHTIKPSEGLSLEAICLRMISGAYVQMNLDIWPWESADSERGAAL